MNENLERKKPRRRRGTGSVFVNDEGIFGIRYYDAAHRQRKELVGKIGKEGELAAQRLLRRRFGEIDAGRFEGDGRKLKLDDLEKLVVAHAEMNGRDPGTIRDTKCSFTHLRDFFGGTRALEIARRMPEYIAERVRVDKKEKKVAAGKGTVRREIAAFRRGLSLAVRAGLLASRPYVATIAEAEPRSGFASDADIDKIVAALDDDLAPLVRFLALSGWRKSEGTNLTWKAVDFAAGEIRLGADETKNGRPRVWPMNALPALQSLMKSQRARTEQLEREQSRIIVNVFHRNGEPIRAFGGAWNKACKAAGKPGLLVHDLRRSAARRMVLAGVPQPIAQKLLGHQTASIFLRYAIVSDTDLADGVAKLARVQ
jgi:integrase